MSTTDQLAAVVADRLDNVRILQRDGEDYQAAIVRATIEELAGIGLECALILAALNNDVPN
jgi:hypothetical protein